MLSQGLKDGEHKFQAQIKPLSILKSLRKYDRSSVNKNSIVSSLRYEPAQLYLRHRRRTLKILFKGAERFGFTSATKHLAISLLDAVLMQPHLADFLPEVCESR